MAGNRLLAPNGRPSNLTPQQYKQVRTPEFKKWFGDWEKSPSSASKVVDENGEPLVCYHGTDRSFYKFDDKKISTNSGNYGHYGVGHYFTTEKREAETYGSNVLHVFLNIRRPFDATKKSHMDKYAKDYGYEKDAVAFDKRWLLKAIKKVDEKAYRLAVLIDEKGYDEGWETFLEDNEPYDATLDLNDISDWMEWVDPKSEEFVPEYYIDDVTEQLNSEPQFYYGYEYSNKPNLLYFTQLGEDTSFTQKIKSDGHDGVMTSGSEMVIFEPTQVKSATDNKGKFNPMAKNITAATEKLLAPNGKPSNLNSVQWKQVRTPEFKKWFGDWENNPHSASKLLDENGEPMVVYRGNLKDYGAEFRYGVDNIPGKWRVSNTIGFFFTTNRGDAKHFTGTSGGNTQAVFLNIRDNVNLSSGSYKKPEDLFNELAGVSVSLRKETKQAINSYIEDIQSDDYHLRIDTFKFLDGGGELLRKDFESSGVDGVFFNESGLEGIVGCVFKPNQIKSATGNSGMFNPKSNDITASLREAKVSRITHRILATAQLLAPNGKPTNLSPEMYKAVRTPAFKKWFGDWENAPARASRVVDENGEPLVVHHGTKGEFTEFKREFIGKNATAEGKGFYFTNKRDIAEGYGSEGTVLDVFLNIRKGMDYERKTITKAGLRKFIEILDPDGSDYLSNWGDVDYDGYSKVLNEAVNSEWSNADNDVDLLHGILNAIGDNYAVFIPAVRAAFKMDGIIVENPSWGVGQTIYIAFESTQIKSTKNTGKYSKKEGNIYARYHR